MEITSERRDEAMILTFHGAADAAAVGEIRQALGQGMDEACCRVVCDLSDISFICSDALGAFISAYQGAREVGGFVRLVHPQNRIADILAITQLNRLFEVFDSVDDAMQGGK
jgi:anti-sigma B factor antagonist